jgi:hypothetical protein
MSARSVARPRFLYEPIPEPAVDDTEVALTNGRWVYDRRAGVLRWHPDPEVQQPTALSIPCPFCDAPAGEHCTSRRGTNEVDTHLRRADAFRQQWPVVMTSSLSPTKEATR